MVDSAMIRRDFYMDDCLTGYEAVVDAKKLVEELKALLLEVDFQLASGTAIFRR